MNLNIPQTIINTIKQSEIKDLITDNSEVALDSILEDGLLKDLPIIGNLFKIYNVSQSISNHIFAKKILKFLYKLEEIPLDDRVKFVEDLDNNQKLKTKIGEKVLLLLNNFDDLEKCNFLADALKLYIIGEIDYKKFLTLSFMIDRLNIAYINELVVAFNFQISGIYEIYDHLLNCGIIKSGGNDLDNIISTDLKFYKTELGTILANQIINLDKDVIKESYINIILQIEITDSIGDYVKNVQTFLTKEEARLFLKSLSDDHFNGSFIGGKQFLDKDKLTRFRRTGNITYEFFYA